jgi:RHS repeat-associated protein
MSRLTARVLPGGETHAFTYTPMGLVASMTDATGTTTFEYDLRDRPARVRRPDGAAVTYAYDAAGNRTGVSTPGGAVTYTYDAGDRLVSLLDPQGLTSTFGYDAAGNVTTVNHANGIESRSEFDSRNRLTQITHAQGATTLRAFQYTFGAAGNRTRVVEDSGRTVDYAYDSLFRLTGETVTLPGQAPSTVSYAYDAAGNRISQAGPNGSTTFVYDANSRLLQAAGKVFTYDGNGNQLTQQDATGLTSYAYDGLNRLVSAASGGTLTHYAYNAMGHRVRKTTAGASIDYLVDPFGRDGLSQVLRETTPSSAIDYTIAGGTLHSMHGAGGTSFYLADGRRSTRMLADVAGAVTDRYDYDGFGNVLARQGATANEYLFDGQRLDGALRQYDLRARIYDPLSGRFSARDPFEGVLLDPGSLHPYTYAHNDPINRSDPGGQFTLLEQMTISAAVGIYAGLGFAAQNFYYYRSAELAFDAGVDAALSFGAFTMDMLGLGSLFRALGAKIVTSVASTFGTKTLISQTTKGEVVPTVVKRTADAVERVAAHHGPTIPPASTVAAMDPARRAMVERALAAVPRTSTPTMEQWLRSLSRETLVEASQVVVVGTHAGVRTVTKYAVRVGIWF